MRFYTKDECEEWLRGLGRVKPDAIPEIHRAHVHYPTTTGRILYLAHWIGNSLMYRSPALVWITEWGIWGPENWHLYYKLRQSYGDLRLLHEAPGHLFLGHESEDLTSFLGKIQGICGILPSETALFFSKQQILLEKGARFP